MTSSKVSHMILPIQRSGGEGIILFIIYILTLYIITIIGVWNGTSNRNRSIVRNNDLEHNPLGDMDRQVLDQQWAYGVQVEPENPDGYV
jgi:hypothetical protein